MNAEYRAEAQRLEPDRRRVLKQAGIWASLLGCGLLSAREASAAGEQLAFGATSLREALQALGGIPSVGAEITLTAPDVAENGAVVPVSVVSRIPGTQEISIVAELNPNPLIARFEIPEGTEPFISTRVKMAQTGLVYAVVRTQGGLYCAFKETRVIHGACAS